MLLVLRTALGRPLSAALEPLGRMALTNYLTATLVVVAAAGPLGLRYSARWTTAMVLAVAVLAVQAVFSRWWLARFRYGPPELGPALRDLVERGAAAPSAVTVTSFRDWRR